MTEFSATDALGSTTVTQRELGISPSSKNPQAVLLHAAGLVERRKEEEVFIKTRPGIEAAKHLAAIQLRADWLSIVDVARKGVQARLSAQD